MANIEAVELCGACQNMLAVLGQFVETHKGSDKCLQLLEHLKRELDCLHGERQIPLEVLASCLAILRQTKKDLEKKDWQENSGEFEFVIIKACVACLQELWGGDSRFALNSQKFYQEEIAKYDELVQKLQNDIKRYHRGQEKDSASKRAKEQELQMLSQQLEDYKKREKEVRAREDAVATWKNHIQRAFAGFKAGNTPIEIEHKRLCELYWWYNIFAAVVVVVLVVIEVAIYVKLTHVNGIPLWYEYLSLIAPIPIAVGLLWGFITQANRAQRQRVVLSKLLRDVKYVEAIMLAMNELSLNVESSVQRINLALDKLLERYLMSSVYGVEERALKNEEKKDGAPYDLLIAIINELRKKG